MKFIKSFFKILSAKQKRSYFYLQILFAFSAAIQVAGIASLAPFIALLSKPEIITTNKYFYFLYSHTGAKDTVSFMIIFAVSIMLLIALSNFLAGYTAWKLFSFSIYVGSELQNRLYGNYIHNNYVFFSSNNSSRLVSILTQEIPRFIYMVIQSFLNLTSQLLIAIIIVIGLFYVDYFLAMMSVLIISGIYLIIFKLLRNKLDKHGQRIIRANKEKIKLVNESLGGIKEVKLLGTENWYEKHISECTQKALKSSAFIGLSGDLPRFIVETVIFLAILGLALYLMHKYGNSGEVISILSLYAVAGYKLLPAIQIVYKSVAALKANGSLVDILINELELSEPKQPQDEISHIIISEPDITLDDVSFHYPGANSQALRNVSLHIKPNTIVAFVGASGAGKSTAVDLILGLLSPDSGELIIDGNKITKSNVRDWQKHIGYVPQNIFLIDDTIVNNIAFGIPKDQININQVVASAKMANIHNFIETLPNQYNTKVGERGAQLSGGQKQRIGIARALYHNTNVLILDEATSALDSITESQIMSEILGLAKTRTIIIIAHRLSTVINTDNIVFFEDGTVTDQGTFEELTKRNKHFNLLVKHSIEKTN